MSSGRRLSSLLPAGPLAGHEPDARGAELAQLAAAWQLAAPEPLRRHARPVHRDGPRLVVQADSAAWATRLRHSRSSLLAGLRAAGCAGIESLTIRVRPPAVAAAAPAPRRPRRPGPSAMQSVEETARGLEDRRLRDALLRLARSLRRPPGA